MSVYIKFPYELPDISCFDSEVLKPKDIDVLGRTGLWPVYRVMPVAQGSEAITMSSYSCSKLILSLPHDILYSAKILSGRVGWEHQEFPLHGPPPRRVAWTPVTSGRRITPLSYEVSPDARFYKRGQK